MKFEDFKRLQPTLQNIGNGRPSKNLTDNQWQENFLIYKLHVRPYPQNIKKMGGRFSQEARKYDDEKYLGPTNWQQYCFYINSVLSAIRHGEHDYCYYLYQILDLLKFHHDTLCTRYCDGYWEVWLEREKSLNK